MGLLGESEEAELWGAGGGCGLEVEGGGQQG